MLRSFAYNAFFSFLLNLFAVGLEEEIFMDFNLDNFGPSYKALISCHVELFCFNFRYGYYFGQFKSHLFLFKKTLISNTLVSRG